MVRKVFGIITRNSSSGRHLCGLHIKGKGKSKSKGTTQSDGRDGDKGKGKGDDQGKGEGKGTGNGEYQLMMSCLISEPLTDDPEIEVSDGSTRMRMTGERFSIEATALLTPLTECITIELEERIANPADA